MSSFLIKDQQSTQETIKQIESLERRDKLLTWIEQINFFV